MISIVMYYFLSKEHLYFQYFSLVGTEVGLEQPKPVFIAALHSSLRRDQFSCFS
jgi:hypothetical protein